MPLSEIIAPYDDTCAVIVTYNIGPSVGATIEAILPQVGRVLVIDNASTDETIDVLRRAEAAHPGKLSVATLDENNLAAAQNRGISEALQGGAGWVLLLDHDSTPAADMLRVMRETYDRHPGFSRVGIVAPRIEEVSTLRKTQYLRRGIGPLFRRTGFTAATMSDVLCVIASGSLIRRRVFEQIGLMDESLEIDSVDRDFCLRAVSAGWRILAVRDAVLRHRLGEARDHAVLGARITTTNHSAERRYTIYRNRLRLWRRFASSLPAFLAFDALALLYDLARIGLLESDRTPKLKAALAGMRDGLRSPPAQVPRLTPPRPRA